MFSGLFKSQFVRNVSILMTGQGGAQVITMLTAPIVARLFVPEDFGVVALFIAIVTILSVPATLRYELAILLPEDDGQALKLINLSFILIFISCIFILLLVTVFEVISWYPSWLESMGYWVWAIPAIVFLRAGIKVIEGWATRKKQYKIMASSDIGQAITTTGSRITLGIMYGTSVWALMLGYVLGIVFKFFVQLRYAKISFFQSVKKNISKADYIEISKEYRDFPTYNMPSGLIRAFAQNIPIIMFGVYFGPVVVGLYAMASRLFRMPVNFLSKAIRRVYMQKLSAQKNASKILRPSYVKMTIWLAALSSVPTIILWYIGADLSVLFLGEQWADVGRFVEVLTPWLFTIIVASPATAVIVVCRKQRMWLRYNIIVACIQFFGFVLAHHLWENAEYALMVFVASGILANLYIMVYAYVTVINQDATHLEMNQSS